MEDLSDEDSSNMDVLEDGMCEALFTLQAVQSQDIQDESEEVFNSLDSWASVE